MSAAKHTPGPWHATHADEWRTASGEHVQFGRIDISAGSKDWDAESYYRIASVSNANDSWQNRANAQLIAAAPELLEALQDAEKALNNIRCCCHHTAWEATGPAVIAARAAIAKATGGAA